MMPGVSTIPRQEYDNADDITMFHWDAVPLSPSCHQSCLCLSGDMRPKSGHNTHTDPAGPRHPTPSVESDVSSLELEMNLREDWSFLQRRPLLMVKSVLNVFKLREGLFPALVIPILAAIIIQTNLSPPHHITRTSDTFRAFVPTRYLKAWSSSNRYCR